MPYIKPERREPLIQSRDAKTPGELNFLLTREIKAYLERQGLAYQTINDVLGALEGAKQEFYRRVIAPYEDEKIRHQGDIEITD